MAKKIPKWVRDKWEQAKREKGEWVEPTPQDKARLVKSHREEKRLDAQFRHLVRDTA